MEVLLGIWIVKEGADHWVYALGTRSSSWPFPLFPLFLFAMRTVSATCSPTIASCPSIGLETQGQITKNWVLESLRKRTLSFLGLFQPGTCTQWMPKVTTAGSHGLCHRNLYIHTSESVGFLYSFVQWYASQGSLKEQNPQNEYIYTY